MPQGYFPQGPDPAQTRIARVPRARRRAGGRRSPCACTASATGCRSPTTPTRRSTSRAVPSRCSRTASTRTTSRTRPATPTSSTSRCGWSASRTSPQQFRDDPTDIYMTARYVAVALAMLGVARRLRRRAPALWGEMEGIAAAAVLELRVPAGRLLALRASPTSACFLPVRRRALRDDPGPRGGRAALVRARPGAAIGLRDRVQVHGRAAARAAARGVRDADPRRPRARCSRHAARPGRRWWSRSSSPRRTSWSTWARRSTSCGHRATRRTSRRWARSAESPLVVLPVEPHVGARLGRRRSPRSAGSVWHCPPRARAGAAAGRVSRSSSTSTCARPSATSRAG